MSLVHDLERNDKKGLFHSDDDFVNYSTGILPLDYANGFWADVWDEKAGAMRKIPILGIIGGTHNLVIGTTGSGKTTFADQAAYNIIRQFEDGVMFHVDAERTQLKQRLMRLTGANFNDERVKLIKNHVSVDEVLLMLDKICEVKEAGGNKYKYEVKNRAWNGRSFKTYFPTVLIVDSLIAFNGLDFETSNTGTNMDSARGAKDIARFYNNCLQFMGTYNITIFCVNHIQPNIITDKYAPPPRGIMMLGPNEKLPRGGAPQQLSQNCFRLNMIKSNIYKPEDVGFCGNKGTIQIAKTKTNFVGASVDVAFNTTIGFDPVYSLYEFANANGLVVGRNPYLSFMGYEPVKWSRKEFARRFRDDKEFQQMTFEALTPHMESLLGAKELTEEESVEYGSYMDSAFYEDGEGGYIPSAASDPEEEIMPVRKPVKMKKK